MDEDLKRSIEDLPVVSSVCFHAGDKTHKTGVYDNLWCSAASSHGGCGVKLVGTIRMSSKFPTLCDCLRELGRLIQQDHCPTCVAVAQELQGDEKDFADESVKRPADEGAASLNANEVLMLHSKLKIIQARAAEEEEFERRQTLVKHQSFWAWLQHTDNSTHFKSKENLNFWPERPAEYAKWLKMVWVEFGCPGHGKGQTGWSRSHDKIIGHT
jgi:hypothetical protein